MKFLILSLALSLTACQGQNPFKRESNPLKNYPHASENANRPYVPGKKAARPEGVGADGGSGKPAQPPCFEPLKVDVSPDYGDAGLKFVEEVTTTYDLKLTVNGYPIEKLVIKKPESASVVFVSQADNNYTWQLKWTAPKDSSKIKFDPVVVEFEDELPKGACAKAVKQVSFKVAVSKTQEVARLSFVDFKEKIKFGDKFDFKVIVEDASGRKPELTLESSAVTKCLEDKVIEGKKFQFACSFDSNLLRNIDKLVNSGRSSDFTISFKTQQNVKASQKIRVFFEKIVTGAKK